MLVHHTTGPMIGMVDSLDEPSDKWLEVFTDTSFAPGGDRSRSGATVFWRGGLVRWYSKRQPLTTLSTPESELGGAIPGIKFGVGVGGFVRQLLPQRDQPENLFTLSGDNTATIITITTDITTWRSRHYAYRAGWARDQVHDGPIKVVHTPGQGLSADPLTKVLQGGAAVTARQALTLTDGNKDIAVILALAEHVPYEIVD